MYFNYFKLFSSSFSFFVYILLLAFVNSNIQIYVSASPPDLISRPPLPPPLLLTYIYDLFLSLSTSFFTYFQTSRPSAFYMKTTTDTRSKDTNTFFFFNVNVLFINHYFHKLENMGKVIHNGSTLRLCFDILGIGINIVALITYLLP